MDIAISRLVTNLAAATAMVAAQPVRAETINTVCKYPMAGGYSDIEVIWADTVTMTVRTVVSLQDRPGLHGVKGGANVDDALMRASFPGRIKTWPATINATTIAWTSQDDTTRPALINRQTGVLTWSTPMDPTPPNQGSAQCTLSDLKVPPLRELHQPVKN